MNKGLFQYPSQAKVGRIIPKTKIYEFAKTNTKLKNQFVSNVQQIEWAFKLSPETLNLKSTKDVQEIQIFTVQLKKPNPDEKLLRCIDEAIPSPIFFELILDNTIQLKSAFKRPSQADSHQWVTHSYFQSPICVQNSPRKTLPVVVSMEALYQQMFMDLMPYPLFKGETLLQAIDRHEQIQTLQKQMNKLEAKIKKENQFNRKVELNSDLRNLQEKIKDLKHKTH